MDVRQAFDEHRGFLWSLAYRMTGNGADADDVVQGAPGDVGAGGGTANGFP